MAERYTKLKLLAQMQYNYNNITHNFCCIAAIRTSGYTTAIQVFFTTAVSNLQVFCKL